MMKNPFKFWVYTQKASGEIWHLFLLTSGRNPSHTPTETAIHYLLPDCCFEKFALFFWQEIIVTFISPLWEEEEEEGRVVKMKSFCVWWKSFTCKMQGKWARRLGGCRAEWWADVFTGAWPLGKQTSQNVDVCENWCATWSKHVYITHTSQGDQIPRQQI